MAEPDPAQRTRRHRVLGYSHWVWPVAIGTVAFGPLALDLLGWWPF